MCIRSPVVAVLTASAAMAVLSEAVTSGFHAPILRPPRQSPGAIAVKPDVDTEPARRGWTDPPRKSIQLPFLLPPWMEVPPPLPDTDDPFILLGLDRGRAPPGDIHRAYRRLVRLYHPDSRYTKQRHSLEELRKAVEDFERIHAAYESLTTERSGGHRQPSSAKQRDSADGGGTKTESPRPVTPGAMTRLRDVFSVPWRKASESTKVKALTKKRPTTEANRNDAPRGWDPKEALKCFLVQMRGGDVGNDDS